MRSAVPQPTVLVHLASGVGNIILATPLLVALHRLQCTVDVLLHADYPQTAELLRDWSVVRAIYQDGGQVLGPQHPYDHLVPAVPPFYWSRFARCYRQLPRVLTRPADGLFYANEQDYYLSFARALGWPADCRPVYCLPIAPAADGEVTERTLVIAPGCKTGLMAAKRWPYFPQLAERFADVVLVGTTDDVRRHDAPAWHFPGHVRSFLDRLTLRQTAALLAAAGAVVGNDSGLAHMAAAVGAPTVMLFGPTPHLSLGQFPPNAQVLRAGLTCEPCWFTTRFGACAARIHCLQQLTVETVEQALRELLG